MAEPRGESQASGRSQYSESVVLNQDIGDLSTIEQDLGGQSRLTNSKAKSTRFNLSPESEVMEPPAPQHRQTYTNMSLQARLRERLYDKPEQSGVMNYVRLLSMRKRPISVVRYHVISRTRLTLNSRYHIFTGGETSLQHHEMHNV